jgi:hypothetical protein
VHFPAEQLFDSQSSLVKMFVRVSPNFEGSLFFYRGLFLKLFQNQLGRGGFEMALLESGSIEGEPVMEEEGFGG